MIHWASIVTNGDSCGKPNAINKAAAALTTLDNLLTSSLKDSVLRFAMYLKGRGGTCVQNVQHLPWV